MVSSRAEAEWDDEQVNLVLAEAEVTALTGENGEWLPEATSPDADPMSYSGLSYVPEGPFTNWAEKTKLDALAEHKKALGDDANTNGVYFTARRKGPPTP